ncbi:ABC transporter ATP-binding protein [Agrobacterium tumefaciens]|uniref:ABC transporter ATP-binding protein n=1 Tax=Agrobacterium tumefaciens TaxID=358 RepID=UPI003BA0788A
MADIIATLTNLSVAMERDGGAASILADVNLTISQGEIVALVGDSGAGKSTLALAMQGLLPRDGRPRVSGSIMLSGTEVVGAHPSALRRIRRDIVRLVPQDPLGALDPTMKIGHQLRDIAPDRQTAFNWLARAGLRDPAAIINAFPHRLSGGERQRVLIAIAMMGAPNLLIADEPTTALDVMVRNEILVLLKRLAVDNRTAVLLITHDTSVARAIADRVVILRDGLLEAGSTGKTGDPASHRYETNLLGGGYDLHSPRDRPLPVRNNHSAGQSLPERWPKRSGPYTRPALVLSCISKSFQRPSRAFFYKRQAIEVLKSVDLTISTGECVSLVGNSGAGKSTLLRIAAGLLAPDTGKIMRTDDRPQVIFQDAVSCLTPWLTIGSQVAERLWALGLTRMQRVERVEAAFNLVGLESKLMHALPSELSMGQCQRAVMARAIVVPPKILLCDEPISALDMRLASATLNLVGNIRRKLDIAVLFVTHDLAAARLVSDRITVIHEGRIEAHHDPDELHDLSKASVIGMMAAAHYRPIGGPAP